MNNQVTMTTPSGETYGLFEHLLKQAHLLIAGASGSGKSVLVNGLICTALYRFPFNARGGAQFILIDPKRVELDPYKNLPHTIGYASEPQDMVNLLRLATRITEQRYREMQAQGVRKYEGSDIFVVIEELADLMLTNRREVQPLIQRLCQLGRACRVRVWMVTQTPIVKVIPTEIKANADGIVALRTRSAQDSRNIIGHNGAELLPRYGECLYYSPDFMTTRHFEVPYVDEQEQDRLIKHWEAQARKPIQARPEPLPVWIEQRTEPRRGFIKRLFGRR